KALYDTSQHVRFLSEALRSGEPVLFHQYTGWLKTLFMGLDFPPDTLTVTLQALRETVFSTNPEGSRQIMATQPDFCSPRAFLHRCNPTDHGFPIPVCFSRGKEDETSARSLYR
ncbi:MAG: hypothetical protein N2442_07075, partial [Spirochaetes bacterium]|nr:hypothetical protein [Spirochaetota bacterium]